MKQKYSRFLQSTVKHVQERYGFLFEKGYEVFSAENVPMGWQVVLKKQALFIKVDEYRGEEELFFRTEDQGLDEFTDIGTVIYAATGDKIPRWESSEPKVLARYLDRIEAYFADEYVKNRDSLRTAQQEYYAAFEHGGVALPPGPLSPESLPLGSKVIPILHYPLMVLITLLIFGALTTLYAAVLDRLFATFSLEADSYSIFMGIGAILLAIGTLLLFWRMRQKS